MLSSNNYSSKCRIPPTRSKVQFPMTFKMKLEKTLLNLLRINKNNNQYLKSSPFMSKTIKKRKI
jgi:hypothetical protein